MQDCRNSPSAILHPLLSNNVNRKFTAMTIQEAWKKLNSITGVCAVIIDQGDNKAALLYSYVLVELMDLDAQTDSLARIVEVEGALEEAGHVVVTITRPHFYDFHKQINF